MFPNTMNAYGHMAPRYPFSKDEMPAYNPSPYSVNSSHHPVNSVATTNLNFQNNYGSNPNYERNYPKYYKEVPTNQLEYNQKVWTTNSNQSDSTVESYSVKVTSSNTKLPYQSELKESYTQNYQPEKSMGQNSWDNPVVNQYSNVRLAIFVENTNSSYELVESDLRELFSYYSGVHSLSISNEYPAAELVVTDPSACSVAAAELNGIVLHGIGSLRCVVMRPGETLNAILSTANIYKFQSPEAVNEDKVTSYQYQSEAKMSNVNSNGKKPLENIGVTKTVTRPVNVNNVEHVTGITNKPNTKRLARFELVDIFSFEPDFDVTNSILGPSNANIQYIMKNSNNKVDISIKGKPLNSAPEPDRLHISITSNDFVSYNKAVFMIEDLLSSVCEKYVDYVKERGKVVSSLVGFRRHEYEEDAEGILDYKGYTDKPKTWLESNPKRYSPYKYRPNFSKKVSDRSRPIPNNVRPPTTRLVMVSKNRNIKK